MKFDNKKRLQPETFEELFTLISQDKGARLILLELGKVSVYFSSIKQDVTIELVDYNISLDNNAINHIDRQHGNQSKEEKRGQIAVVKDDFPKLEKIVMEYDDVSYAGINKSGSNQIIQFEKALEEILHICLMEVRVSHKRLNLKTMYKRGI